MGSSIDHGAFQEEKDYHEPVRKAIHNMLWQMYETSKSSVNVGTLIEVVLAGDRLADELPIFFHLLVKIIEGSPVKVAQNIVQITQTVEKVFVYWKDKADSGERANVIAKRLCGVAHKLMHCQEVTESGLTPFTDFFNSEIAPNKVWFGIYQEIEEE